ncbi:MAG: ComEA family DNA-binding protein [Phycisphaerales bacterium]
MVPDQDRIKNHHHRASSRDWSSTPAGIFSAALLAIASLTGLGWSLINARSSTQFVPPQQSFVDRHPHQPDLASPEHASDPSQGSSTNQAPARLVIDINTATADQLRLLPSIGPKLAQRIIDDRTTNGPYESIAQLDRVSGIGPKTITKLTGWIAPIPEKRQESAP